MGISDVDAKFKVLQFGTGDNRLEYTGPEQFPLSPVGTKPDRRELE